MQEVVYTFGQFRLFPGRQLLTLDGSVVKLGGRAFELLHLLVQRSSELISKDELMAAAWPGIFVHESNLKVNMHTLRRSLGDTQKQPSFIATIAGRGYRFIAPVQLDTLDSAEALIAPSAGEPSRLPPRRDIVAREQEIARLVALLQRKSQITVLGPAGVGKTTVAIAAARTVEADFADGTCFVDLTMIDDPSFVPSALAASLGLRGEMGDTSTAVVEHLRQRSVLLLIDNCEHVLPAITMFGRKMGSQLGRSKLLATSREPLGLPSETIMWLETLACPDEATPATASDVLRFPAVELLVRRASDWFGYQLEDADCAAIARICRALDGLPLAIELTAGKLELHTASDLLAMLDGHLGFKSDRADVAPKRHETLLAAIDWSYGLLSENEATIFCLVSVFAGAFELEDVVALAAAKDLAPFDVIAGLGGLVAKSLLTAQVNGAGLRYRLLDSTRRYATRQRREAGLEGRARRLHAQRILALFEQSETEWGWRDSNDWTRAYLDRIADVHAALAWAFGDRGDPALGVRLTVAAIPLWFETSLLPETRTRVALALDHANKLGCEPLLKTKLANSLAWSMMYGRTLVPEIEEVWLDAVAFARQAGSVDHELRALVALAIYLMLVGRVAESMERLRAFRVLCALHQDWSLAPESERMLAWAMAHAGELTEGLAMLEGLATTHARVGKGSRMAGFQVDRYIGIRCYIPLVSWVTGHPDHAASVASDAIEAAAGLGHLPSQANALGLAGCPVAYLNGDIATLHRYTTRLLSILEMETIGIWLPMQRFFAAALEALQGKPARFPAMKEAISAIVDSRYLMRVPAYVGILAELLARESRLDEASDAIAEAMRFESRQGERWCRAELMRIEALILDRAGHRERAERLLLGALDEAHAIDALSFELRIASDLAAIYLEKDQSNDAVALVAPVYGRFKEGFATKDLTRAATLLRRANGHPA